MLSSRIPAHRGINRLTRALARLRNDRVDIADLTESNPTRVGLDYPPDLLAPLASPAALTYAPHPRGLRSARQAVAAHLGGTVDPDHIVLTASTSEAYALLLKLLCDPGDTILAPQPSYPLFEHLARFEGVDIALYPLVYDGDAWTLDRGALRAAARSGARAVIAVNPNNPTGSYLGPSDRVALGTLCRDLGIPLIVDEVFNRYPIDPRRRVARSFLDAGPDAAVVDTAAAPAAEGPVTFVLGGLSKSVGLPQLKLGWIAATGSAPLDALDLLTDTYLSVASPVQLAAAHLLTAGAAVTRQIQSRITANYRTLAAAVAAHPIVTRLRAEGGWSAIVRFAAAPDPDSEEALALDLLEQDHILVHPGYFFDIPGAAHVVVSLLPEPARFAPAAARLVARAARESFPIHK